jgi:hypothetical protein
MSWGRIHKSRESCGVGFLKNQAEQYDGMFADYKKAEDSNVPTPAASRFLQGSVKPGIALLSTNITSGRFFALKSGTGHFEQVIHSITDINVFRECAVEPLTLSSEPSVRP